MPARRAARVNAKSLARAVMEHHLGAAPRRVEPASGGLTNDVLEVAHAEGEFVVRIGRVPEKLNAYIKEQWAMKHAAQAGVPVPEVLEVGNEAIGRPYMVSRRVDGVPGTGHPDRHGILRQLGEIAARVHSVRTNGFGGTFDWSHNRLSHNPTPRDFLRRELEADTRIAALKRHRMIDAGQAARLATACRALERSRKPSILNHGDLRLKNVMVDDRGQIVALIDWDEAIAASGPAWDLSIALHDLDVEEKQAFAEGYGFDARRLRELLPGMRAFNLLNYGRHVKELADKPDRAALAGLKLRLAGVFDLYSL